MTALPRPDYVLRLICSTLLLTLFASACWGGATGTHGGSTHQRGHGASLDCGTVRPVAHRTRVPGVGRGIELGPLQIDLLPFVLGRPTKTLVGTATQLGSSLSLRGWRCGDGVAMRFFYAQNPRDNQLRVQGVVIGNTPVTRRFSISALMRAGQNHAYFKRRQGQHVDYLGYFIFPSAGKYFLQLYAGHSKTESAVIDTSEVARP